MESIMLVCSTPAIWKNAEIAIRNAFEVGKSCGYINVLRQLLPSDVVSPTASDLAVPLPAVNALLHITPVETQKVAYRYQVDSVHVLSMYSISLAILNVILSFVSGSYPFTLAITSHIYILYHSQRLSRGRGRNGRTHK